VCCVLQWRSLLPRVPMPEAALYHHSEPYFVHADKHKTHSWKPVIVYSAAHGHYHLTYHPDE
jgi:hypothetical protein